MNRKRDLNAMTFLQKSWPVLVIGVGLLSVVSFRPLVAQESPRSTLSTPIMTKTLTVTGKGTERTPATIAQISLGVEAQGKTAAAVQEEVAKRSAAVVALLKARKVERLQTSGVSLRPNYSYENNTQRLTGYIASNTVSFRLEASKVGDLLDASVNAGATRIDDIRFTATDEAIAQTQQQALRKATQDAQTQAQAVFGALNFTQREIVSVQINGASPPQPVAFMERGRSAKQDLQQSEPTQIEAGEQEVEASVTLQISY
jgi:uncharacterized protein